ncbi:MAG: kelch repeat-containing protein [Polyangiaceae bacterium]
MKLRRSEVSPRGFMRDEPSALSHALDVVLPETGDGAVLLRSPSQAARDALEVRIHEVSAHGSGRLENGVVAYARAGGTSYWAVSDAGAEEWLAVAPGLAWGDRVLATWEISGASLRELGDAVLLVDPVGRARIRVTAPEAITASGRRVPAILSTKGNELELTVDADGEEVLVDPAWVSAASMVQARAGHTAALLPNGRVLVAGGSGPINNLITALSSAELYDTSNGTWLAAPAMSHARLGHTSTTLANSQVLIAGGWNPSDGRLSAVEHYDPSSSTWLPTAPLNTGREHHSATLLADGRVLVAGGLSPVGTEATAEIYEPSTMSWTPAASMSAARQRHEAALLSDGRVLVLGGYDGSYLASAELYDPTTGLWSPAAQMGVARSDFSAVALADGRVLVAGGHTPNGVAASAELYDPETNSWAAAQPMSTPRAGGAAAQLQNGNYLVSGGFSGAAFLSSAEVYSVTADTWTPFPPMSVARGGHTLTRFPNGLELLAAGGGNDPQSLNGVLASSDVYSDLGEACLDASDCWGGHCVDGVCCDAACDGESCHACSVAAGAAVDGRCALLSGNTCDDADACTTTDVCESGVCIGTSPVLCMAMDECHAAGTCTPDTGQCSNPSKPDGSPCSIGSCVAGVCTEPPSTSTSSSGAGGEPNPPVSGGSDAGGAGGSAAVSGDDEASDGCACTQVAHVGDHGLALCGWAAAFTIGAARSRRRRHQRRARPEREAR